MERVIRVFSSFEEADEYDAAEDARLTPEQRLQITIQLRDLAHPDAAQQGLARIYRITELRKS